MSKLKWRRKAAVVGYLDVVLTLCAIVLTTVAGVFIVLAWRKIKQAEKDRKLNPDRENDDEIVAQVSGNQTETIPFDPQLPFKGHFLVDITIIWVCVGLAAAFYIIQLVAAIKFLKATEANYDRKQAVCPTRFWVIINGVLVVISIPNYIFIVGPLGAAGYGLYLIVRCIMIYIGYQFLQELLLVTTVGKKPPNTKTRVGPV